MRKYLLTFLFLAAIGASWYAGARLGLPRARTNSEPDRDSENIVAAAQAGRLIHGQGKLEPASGLMNIVAAPGERIAFMTKKTVGDMVDADEILVTLQTRVLREKDFELAKARRADALKNFEFEKQQATFKLKSAELALAEASASDQKIAEQAKSIDLLNSQLDVASQLLQRLQRMKSNPATKTLVNQTDVDKQGLLVKQLELQIEQAQLNVEMATQSAARAKQVAENNLQTMEFTIANAKDAAPLETLDAAVALARQGFELTQIRSPIDHATILEIIVREGDSVTNQPIMVLGDLSEMNCKVEVVDSFLKSIDVEKHQNLRARITGNALENPLMGSVIAKGIMIGPVSNKNPNPFAKVDQRTGVVTIRLDDPAAAAEFVNLQVSVEIETEPGTLSSSVDQVAVGN